MKTEKLTEAQELILFAACRARGQEICVATSDNTSVGELRASAAACRGLIVRGYATGFSIHRAYRLKITYRGNELIKEIHPLLREAKLEGGVTPATAN